MFLQEKRRELSYSSDRLLASRQRNQIIIRTSIIGILANVLLSVFKSAVGIISGSIAIVMDAVNNLSDAASSLITIIGTKLAGKAPDRKHPFGHGRGEYLSAMIISVLVLYAGLTSLIESFKKILSPKTPDYSAVTLVIVAFAVLVKIVLGRYVQQKGEQVHSDSLINSGKDALNDSIISASTLVAAIIFLTTGLSLEPYLGLIISLLIIKSGVDMLRETISQLLGERVNLELARSIKKTVTSFPDVTGAYDLILNNYGPDLFTGSIHIEVPDTYTVLQLDELSQSITHKVLEDNHVILTAIGVYPTNTGNEKAAQMKRLISEIVLSHEYVMQLHGFYVNEVKKTIRFDVIISFDAKDREAVYQHIVNDVSELYPDYKLLVALDTDFSES